MASAMQASQELRVSPKDTRLALINAAIEVFGAFGYNGATTRQIAKTAGVNLAAIPYYFGGKEDLYLAVIEWIINWIIEGVKDSFPVAEEIDRIPEMSDHELIDLMVKYVRAYATSLDGKQNTAAKLIIAREQIIPSPAFKMFYDKISQPQYTVFCGIIGRLMRLPSDDFHVTLQVHSIISQMIFFSISQASLLVHLRSERLEPKHLEAIIAIVDNNTRAILECLVSEHNSS